MQHLAFIQNLNGPEIFLIFLIVLLLFGAKRLPELFRSFGKSIKEFKKATNEIEDDIRTAMEEESAAPKPGEPKSVVESKPAEPAAAEPKPVETSPDPESPKNPTT